MRVKELFKSILLVALSLMSLWLAWNTWVYDPALLSAQRERQPGGKGMVSVLTAAARPGRAMVSSESGRRSVCYDASGMQVLYLRVSPVLGEVFGSASAPENVSEAVWRSALSGSGIYLEYFSAVPLGVLAGWLGASVAAFAEFEVSSLLASAEPGGGVSLMFKDALSGGYYRSVCAADAGALLGIIQEYEPDGSFFAFEGGAAYMDVPGEMIIRPGKLELGLIGASNPLDGEKSMRVLRAVGMNPYSNSHTEQGGTVVYVDNACTLRILPGGAVRYSNRGEPGGPAWDRLVISEKPDNAAMIEFVRKIGDDALSQMIGDAEISFGEISVLPSGSVRIKFRYVAGGMQVYLNSGCAVDALITDGRVAELNFEVRRYELLKETAALIPMTQAALLPRPGAAAEAAYLDDGDGVLTPAWVS